MQKAVVLVSGGADSATVLAMIEKMNYEIHAISFNYSQHNNIELEKVKELVKNYNIKQHKIVNIDLRSFGGSALTDDAIEVPKYKDHSDLGDNIPITYVPARNTIFLSYALGFSEIIGAFDIFMGVHATDYANYPDCRPEYLDAFEKLANLATAVGVLGTRITIHAPLINMTKGQIIKTGLELGVDYSKTISCYDPLDNGLSCGTCHACLLRLKAFEENNTIDPINYKSKFASTHA
ncbi:7-cyano-7-deazaguanine synthase QueC [Candidatus Tisiphia endosymbiont of Piscicola geometra]|uniref:7-cyano-7-deazaguanine synthase QueC n=1 Tax=Candidatus Tisiphia endosymbiont of Piscicola geometra TaxID=3066273 RepID=UPI00312C77C7